MSYQITLPPLKDGATEFIVEHYYVNVDTPVVAGQAVALVRSKRFVWSIPATASGMIGALLVEPGDTIAIGAPLTEMREQGTEGNGETGRQEDGEIRSAAIQNPNTQRVPAIQNPQRVRATPVARRMAANHDVDLSMIVGTGRGNIITRADVLAAIGARGKGRGTRDEGTIIEETQPSATLPSSIFHLPSSILSVPYALTAIEVDLSAAQAFIALHERRARRGVTISITACVAAAAVAALNEHRLLNSAWSDDGIIVRSRVHLVIEQSLESGAHAALVTDAADLNSLGLARRLAQTNEEQPAHNNADRQADHHRGTFAIAHRSGSWWAHAQPSGTHTASLTIGEVAQQPRVVETAHGDTVALRPVALLVLAYDARVVDHPQADAFLRTLQQRLEHLDRL